MYKYVQGAGVFTSLYGFIGAVQPLLSLEDEVNQG